MAEEGGGVGRKSQCGCLKGRGEQEAASGAAEALRWGTRGNKAKVVSQLRAAAALLALPRGFLLSSKSEAAFSSKTERHRVALSLPLLGGKTLPVELLPASSC